MGTLVAVGSVVLTIYLACIALGGLLIGFSLFAHTGDGDADHDADHDTDADHGSDAAEHGHAEGEAQPFALSTALPIASLRFWTFFLAFGGLTGALLSWLSGLGSIATAVVSVGVAWASGFGVTMLLRRLRRSQVSSALRPEHCIGATGTVLLPVARGSLGRVRVTLEDRVVDFDADTDDASALPIAEPVLVYEIRDDGVALVSSAREHALSGSVPARNRNERKAAREL